MIEINYKYAPLYTKTPPTRYTIVTGGRASAKSFTVTDAVAQYMTLPNQVIMFSRYTMSSARRSIIPEFEEKIALRGEAYRNQFIIGATDIAHPSTNSICYFSGIKTSTGSNTAKIKGTKNMNIFVLDEAEEMTDYEEFQKIAETVRMKGVGNRIILVMNPSNKNHFIYSKFINTNRADFTHIHTTYLDNIKNLDPDYVLEIERTKRLNPKRYKHIFLGEWLDDVGGLLWNDEIINNCHIFKLPKIVKTIVAIDPATTNTSDSDETGIIVVGRDAEGNGYVLEDVSGRYSPEGWAKAAKLAAEKWGAFNYVAEKNQGGDMVYHILRQYDSTRKIKLVTATKGKLVRADPIYSLYEQDKIKHVGNFKQLEEQLKYYNPTNSKISPDRMDALVWGFTELILNKKRPLYASVS